MAKRQTKEEIRREALEEVRASVRADILLDGFGLLQADIDPLPILERVTKSIDQVIAS